MKACNKTILRGFKKNISRLISITIIIFLGIAFVEGLGTLAPTIERSFSNVLNEQNAFDLDIKATDKTGISDEFIQSLQLLDGVKDVEAFTVIEYDEDESNILGNILPENTRAYFLPESGFKVNELEIIEGRMPENGNEIVVERSSEYIKEVKVGDKVVFNITYLEKTIELEVVGIVGNPSIFDTTGEPLLTDQDVFLESIYYLHSDFVTDNFGSLAPIIKTLLVPTDVYLTFNDTQGLDRFSGNYLEKVNKHKEEIENLAKSIEEQGPIKALTLEQTKSYIFLSEYCDKVQIIALIFPLFFILVTSLVVLTTMSRMIEEERAMIACQKSIGVSDMKILSKYIIFSMVALLVGSFSGMAVGMYLMPAAIFPAFTISFYVPPMSAYVELTYGLVSMLFMLIATFFLTIYVVRQDLKLQPAQLLLPKAPKAGKKIFLEYIPFIWKRLSFKYKSSIRNIFRYKKHLFMTVISISGSTALVFAGFALMAISQDKTTEHFESIGNTLLPISFVIMIFAILLSIFVIYNLTNMNIQERQREIATLSVLGYHDFEVATYIFREIMTMAIFGIVIGIPLGVLLVWGVFEYIDFGKISSVSWYYYIATILLIIVFVIIVDLMFYRKIKKIDMTSSLKSVD